MELRDILHRFAFKLKWVQWKSAIISRYPARTFIKLKDLRGRVTIQRRIDRIANGNFGDHQFCQDGVWELRIHFGPGYRVYYGREGETVVVLLGGGSKRTQSADIKEAVRYWLDYQQRRKT